MGPGGGKRCGRAASGGASGGVLAPPLAARCRSRTRTNSDCRPFFPCFFCFFYWDRTSPRPEIVDIFTDMYFFEIGESWSPLSKRGDFRSEKLWKKFSKRGFANIKAGEKRDINLWYIWSDSCGARRLWAPSACCAPNFSEITNVSQKHGQDSLRIMARGGQLAAVQFSPCLLFFWSYRAWTTVHQNRSKHDTCDKMLTICRRVGCTYTSWYCAGSKRRKLPVLFSRGANRWTGYQQLYMCSA